MILNISDEEFIVNPSAADIQRAIAMLVVETEPEFHGEDAMESFVVLMAADRKGDFIEASKLGPGNYSVGYRMATTGRAYRRWGLAQDTVVALFERFRCGERCLATPFIWCDHTEWSGEIAQTPRGWDEEAEERLEEDACITVGDVTDLMLDMRERNPDLADMLEAGMDDPDAPGNQGAILTRAISLAWMRVTIGEDALDDLHDIERRWATLPEKKQRAWRKEWASWVRSLGRLTRDREQWDDDLELEAKWVELRAAFRAILPVIERLELVKPPTALIENGVE